MSYMAKSAYNPSLLMPIVDVVVGVALFVGAGVIWFNSRGQEQIIEAREQLQETRRQQRVELAELEGEIVEAQDELVAIQNERQAKQQYVEALEQRIETETGKIEDAEELDRRYTDRLLDLREDIEVAQDALSGYRAGVAEESERIDRRSAELDSLQSIALARSRRVSELENEIAEARAVRRHDPWSIFPVHGGFMAAYEIGDEDNRIVAGLSHDIFDIQNLRVGLQGALGLSSQEETSLKEGGVYLNIPLIFRRASVEVGAGLQGTQVGNEDTEYDPYLSGLFRLAPMRSERFFLLGGPQLSPENVAFRLGLGIGRR
ncbi:MAG: hypothetical protein GF355_17805 [Candidatus Eisenbacteria bacterium]|nr:hypothetical protein [Candidatus Eisenbacteria bacterium]